jgi:glycine betaine/proline transport system substrate-binding protein
MPLIPWRFAVALLFATSCVAYAQDLPGRGKTLQPGYEGALEGLFQTYVVTRGLEQLGYQVKKEVLVRPAVKYVALAQGDIDFFADGWIPTQESFWKGAGGDEKLAQHGPLVANASAGYFVDKKTADKYKIRSVEQLKDPAIAKLFDTNGSGKAALYGCPQGWGCEKRIEHHLDAYGLRNTVRHVQGEVALLQAEVLRLHKEGQPVLFFTYSPQWLSQVLVPERDVVTLTVPFTSLPPGMTGSTTLPDGRNVGHVVNNIYIMTRKDFAQQHPAAARLFALMKIPVADVNEQNHRIYLGEKSLEQVRGHADAWIQKNKAQFDSWLAEARRAR